MIHRSTRWLLVIFILLLDQESKFFIFTDIPFQTHLTIIDNFFNITYLQNTGAAFGILNGKNGLFMFLASIVSLFLLLFHGLFKGKVLQISWILLLAGILGNLIDRLHLGYVIDFLDFHYHQYHWPSFNIADMSICSSVFLLLIEGFF